ncbi:MAG: M20/M25/M40 family metallo-hydrolase [Candidatus Limnocylindria bacterium]
MREEQESTGEVTELLQQLIRNRCVNDGTPESGQEVRSAETLAAYLAGPGVEMRRFEPLPGRASLVLRIEGSDPKAPSLALMGHIDVVPVGTEGWDRDPFGGDIVDGEVWGRGAIDMLGITASMAVGVKRLLREGWRPHGTLVYIAVADEEAMGTHGALWLVENELDAVRTDYLVTEFGGAKVPIGNGARTIMVAEKGSHWVRLRTRGVPGHGSMPYRSENAVVRMAEVVRRVAAYRPPAVLDDTWRRFVTGIGLSRTQRMLLTRGWGVELALSRARSLGVARYMHAVTHTTFSPNVSRGGVKINVIPDTAEAEVDIRTLPNVDGAEVRRMLKEAIGDLWDQVEIVAEGDNVATVSPMDTPLWDALERTTKRLVPGATVAPFTIMGATDSRYFRRKGVVCYGYGLMSDRIPFDRFARMFHGQNERIDQESLRLMVGLWEGTAREMLG